MNNSIFLVVHTNVTKILQRKLILIMCSYSLFLKELLFQFFFHRDISLKWHHFSHKVNFHIFIYDSIIHSKKHIGNLIPFLLSLLLFFFAIFVFFF